MDISVLVERASQHESQYAVNVLKRFEIRIRLDTMSGKIRQGFQGHEFYQFIHILFPERIVT